MLIYRLYNRFNFRVQRLNTRVYTHIENICSVLATVIIIIIIMLSG